MTMNPSQASSWKPVLEGIRSELAWQAVRELACTLAKADIGPASDPSLARGSAGVALFYGYLAKATGEPEPLALCHEFLDAAADRMCGEPLGAGLYGGYAGIGWAATHLRDLLDPGAADPAADIDEFLCAELDREDWPLSYDLVEGLVGIGVYALERQACGEGRKAGREILARVIGHLDRLAIAMEPGIAWFTPPALLPPWARELMPQGLWDLGLAHGIPGILALLGRAQRTGAVPHLAGPLFEQGMAWLLAQRNPEGSKGWFTSCLPMGQENLDRFSRVAWCYGDLGLATALAWPAHPSGNSSRQDAFLQIARDAAARSREDSGVRDAGLCHGTAGNALLFLRLRQATGAECFHSAALDYLDWTMEMRTPGGAFGGFPQAFRDEQEGWSAKFTAGLLEGSAGVGLVLLAALTDQPPNWDRHLLVSMEPRQ